MSSVQEQAKALSNVAEQAKALWGKEQIRVLVLGSLAIQVVLTFLAPLRRRSGSKPLLFFLWSLYLGADYIATLALGSILTDATDNTVVDSTAQNLTAFWAPFLLLHLGGPDTITSYAIEDNKLWLRHFIGFVVQVSVALRVLIQSNLQRTTLLVPSLLIFVIGTLKFGERTLALRAANKAAFGDPILDRKPDLKDASQYGESRNISEEKLIDAGNFGAMVLGARMDNKRVTWNLDENVLRTWKDRTFEMIGVELSLFYDCLHTKASVNNCFKGWLIRIASVVSISIALSHFRNSEKQGQDSLDVIITYILLSVALCLEIYSLLLLVASTRTCFVICTTKLEEPTKPAEVKRWWPGHIGQHSILQSHLKFSKRKSGGRHIIVNLFQDRWDFLFKELFKEKRSVEVSGAMEKAMVKHVEKSVNKGVSDDRFYLPRKLSSSWIANTLDEYGSYLSESKDHLNTASFEECVVTWHVYTEICYHASSDENNADMRQAIYKISNYMVHLLLERSSMMPPGRMESVIRVNHLIVVKAIEVLLEDGRQDIGQICQGFLEKVNNLSNKQASGCSDAPWLFLPLWKDLRKIGESSVERQWEVIGAAWMEMLTYAALRCSPDQHASTLSRGGELLTHYWLLWGHVDFMEKVNYDEELLIGTLES